MTKTTFWELLDTDNPTCDTCKTELTVIDDATFYCPQCKSELTLCGGPRGAGTCEGIAYEGPYIYQDGKRTWATNLISGCCEICGDEWEVA